MSTAKFTISVFWASVGIVSHQGQASLTFLLFSSQGYCGWLESLNFFYGITILSVKAEAQLLISRMGSTSETLVAKCFAALTDVLSFMGSFKRSEIVSLCFWKTRQMRKQHFHSLWLICISYPHSSPSIDIASCRMTSEEHLWSTLSLILYNACKLYGKSVITTGALKKHKFHPSYIRGESLLCTLKNQASTGLLS